MNGLYNTIFKLKLLYEMDEHCLPEALDNECAELSSKVSMMNSLFKTIFQVTLSYFLEAVFPGRADTVNMQGILCICPCFKSCLYSYYDTLC